VCCRCAGQCGDGRRRRRVYNHDHGGYRRAIVNYHDPSYRRIIQHHYDVAYELYHRGFLHDHRGGNDDQLEPDNDDDAGP
jgi:hypothetical protein